MPRFWSAPPPELKRAEHGRNHAFQTCAQFPLTGLSCSTNIARFEERRAHVNERKARAYYRKFPWNRTRHCSKARRKGSENRRPLLSESKCRSIDAKQDSRTRL